jgi:sulfoxide reductase catalytic subunit YedY
MLIKSPRGWEIPENAATPESMFYDRRRLLKGLASGSILGAAAAAISTIGGSAFAHEGHDDVDPSSHLYPVERNTRYMAGREITPEGLSSTYNNFYEYGSHKEIWEEAQQLRIRPWEVKFDGMLENEFTIGIDELLAAMPLEERVYRHRCVERWSMVVPWSGFPLKALVDFAKPLSGAKYIKMVTFLDKSMAPGQKEFWWPWPYTEGLTMAEAVSELPFMVTGVYGKPLKKQFGAPLRLATPWKYGFKSVKSIVQISFTDKRPKTFWELSNAKEYGFWANVNPEVRHPRWSQSEERLLGGGTIPTQIYNGYGDFVAHLYEGMDKSERLFI